MRGVKRVFHTADGGAGGKVDSVCPAMASECAGRQDHGQRKTELKLLIGCGKVEIPVDGLWEGGQAPLSGQERIPALETRPQHRAGHGHDGIGLTASHFLCPGN